MERSIPYALLDNIIGFDDDHITPGEKLKKAVGEDPLGVATTVVKGVGKAAKSAFDRVLEEGPLDALTGSLNDYSRDLVGAGTRLKSGTQGYIDSGMTQAEARDKQISDALRLSELIPLMGSAATGFRAGRVALPEAPFDSSRRSFLGGIAALPAVAAIAPDVFSDALKSVGPKVARTTSSLDVSVAKIKDLLKQKDLLEQQSDTLRMDPSFDNRNALSQESVKKDRESFQVQDEIEQTARRALDDLNPTDLSNAADDSIEMIAEQFSTSGVLQYDMDSPAFDKLMEQVKLRGMHTAKDSNGIDQFPYARDIYEDYYNPIRNDTGGFSSSVFKAPQNLNMVESRPVAPDIVEKMKDLEISNFQQQIGLQETEMIAKGASASEIDAMKEGFRQKIFKLQNGNREDFSEDFFADGGVVMNGIGSLNETARGMSRGPRGIAGYQQFANGGPVYMANGGSPAASMIQRPMGMSPSIADDSFMRFPTMPPQAPPSNIRGDGMSANDLQRMLSRQNIAQENVADVQSDIQNLQQADVAKRAAARRDEAARRAREGNNPIREATPQPMPMPMGPFGRPMQTPMPFTQQPMPGATGLGGIDPNFVMDPATQQSEMYQALLAAGGQGSSVNTTMGSDIIGNVGQQPMNIMGQPMQQPQFGTQPMNIMGQPMQQQMPQSQFDYGYDSTFYKGSGGIGNLAPAQQIGVQQQNTGGFGSAQPTANVLF